MANKTYYERGDTFVDANDKPAIIRSGNALTFTDDFKAGGGADLAPATAETLGGVKVGNGLNVASDGTLSVAGVDYSTTEHLTGRKWIDGKDICEKVVNIGALPNNTTKQIAHSITYDTVISLKGICSNGDNTYLPLPAVATASQYAVELSIDTTNIVITTAQDRSAFSGYVILEYTKPTPAETNNTRTVKKSTSKKG